MYDLLHNFETVGENAHGRLLSATSVKVGNGFRLALPTGAYYTWKGSILGGTPIEPDERVEFDWRLKRSGIDARRELATEYVLAARAERAS